MYTNAYNNTQPSYTNTHSQNHIIRRGNFAKWISETIKIRKCLTKKKETTNLRRRSKYAAMKEQD